jgi:16S rRNA (guanine(966)-N(2))-methyltransferase RsmD
MRITGGKSSGRILKAPKGLHVRPTPDLVKQAVFNSLGERGTGALSLECLSRGAVHAVCVEKAERHARAIRQNLNALPAPPPAIDVRVQDVFVALSQLAAAGQQFDLVLADPPYGEKNVGHRSHSLAQRLLDDTSLPRVIRPDGLFVLGHTKRDTLEFPSPWSEVKTLRHGDSVMRFLRVG